MCKIIGKEIPGWEGLYSVTTQGAVWSIRKQKFLTPVFDKDNRQYVSLNNKGKRKNFKIYTLIALTYIPNPENKPTVDHIDRNKLNNDISNLRWATMEEQQKNRDFDAMKNHCLKIHHKAVENAAIANSKSVAMYDMELHDLLEVFQSAYQAAKIKFNNPNNASLITRNCKGKCNSAYGYFWQYY